MSTSSKLIEMFARPGIVGLIAYIGSMAIDPAGGRVIIFGYSIGLNTYYAVTTMGASFVGQSLKQWILPLLPDNGNYVQLESAFLLPALTGLVDGALFQLLNAEGFREAFIVGFGSEIAGGYIYDNVIRQYVT